MAYDEVLVMMPKDKVQWSLNFPELKLLIDTNPLPTPDNKGVRYVAVLDKNEQVAYLCEIVQTETDVPNNVLRLIIGNRFRPTRTRKFTQTGKFDYFPLAEFGLKEVQKGYLVPL